MKKVNKSKGISGNGICEWGGKLADFKTAYDYQIAYDRYFAGMTDTLLARFIYGNKAGSDTYDANLGEITADGVTLRTSGGANLPTAEAIKALWTMTMDPLPISVRINLQIIMYGRHQVC